MTRRDRRFSPPAVRRRRAVEAALALLLVLLLAGCAGIRGTTWVAPEAELAPPRAFAVVPPDDGVPAVRGSVQQAIEEVLVGKGYERVPAHEAALVVHFRGSTEERSLSRNCDIRVLP